MQLSFGGCYITNDVRMNVKVNRGDGTSTTEKLVSLFTEAKTAVKKTPQRRQTSAPWVSKCA